MFFNDRNFAKFEGIMTLSCSCVMTIVAKCVKISIDIHKISIVKKIKFKDWNKTLAKIRNFPQLFFFHLSKQSFLLLSTLWERKNRSQKVTRKIFEEQRPILKNISQNCRVKKWNYTWINQNTHIQMWLLKN